MTKNKVGPMFWDTLYIDLISGTWAQLLNASKQVLLGCGVIPSHSPQLFLHWAPYLWQLVAARSPQLPQQSQLNTEFVRAINVLNVS